MESTYRAPSPQKDASIMPNSDGTSHSSEDGCQLQSVSFADSVAEPQTPARGRNSKLCFGLLSPNTPRLSPDTLESLSSLAHHRPQTNKQNSDIDTILALMHQPESPLENIVPSFQEANLEETARDATVSLQKSEKGHIKLANELGTITNTTFLRRSRRISAKINESDTSNVPPPPQPTKALKTSPIPSTSILPEPSINSYEITPTLMERIPAIHSLDWQLQYPPGGSTHPSYPYPWPDPRLVFRQHFVPIVEGLPEVSKVPKLILPIGWKHVTWTGLIPIAFDPYRQAFKLSPVGPMPLTCEELHQMGLQEYVPGGKFHPETPLLPQILPLSDGSDGDVYNWDGVDWVLPWAATTCSDDPITEFNGANPKSFSSSVLLASSLVIYPWREARDCPNGIYDLSDGWRWLVGKEQNPFGDFVPSPSKQWRNSGAFRSTRKLKSPIPELMMIARLQSDSTPDKILNPILQNQDAPKDIRKYCEFCPFKSVATPMNVDITLLGDTEFTMHELLCYFPQHFNWGHVAERLTRAGIAGSCIRDMVNLTRGLTGEAALKHTNINRAMSTAKKRDVSEIVDEEEDHSVAKDSYSDLIQVTTNYSAEGWTYDVWENIDYPLLALAHGLLVLPIGKDAGPLTALIRWVKEKGRYDHLISEVPDLLKEAEISPLIEPSDEGCPDREFVLRHAEAMKIDRKRVRETLDDSEMEQRKMRKTE